MYATISTPCPVFPGLCTVTEPGHVDHWNHEHQTVDKRGERILDVGFVQVSDGAPAGLKYGTEDNAPEEVNSKPAGFTRPPLKLERWTGHSHTKTWRDPALSCTTRST